MGQLFNVKKLIQKLWNLLNENGGMMTYEKQFKTIQDMRKDPILFCEKYLGIKLHWYQKLYLKLYYQFNKLRRKERLLCKARNSNRSTLYLKIAK